MDSPSADQVRGVDAPLAKTAEDHAQFRAIFEAELDYVVASLARLGVPDGDRDDLASEVFVRVHRQLHAFDPRRPIRPWLFAFAARVASENRRLARNRREIPTDAIDAPSSAPRPDAQYEEAESQRIVARALEALDLDKRAVFVLHDLDDTPVPEIARALAIPEGTAYSRLRAARAEFAAAVRRITQPRSS
jgi:RNA polymerase sigma-70 factor (ECF subfamily)